MGLCILYRIESNRLKGSIGPAFERLNISYIRTEEQELELVRAFARQKLQEAGTELASADVIDYSFLLSKDERPITDDEIARTLSQISSRREFNTLSLRILPYKDETEPSTALGRFLRKWWPELEY